MNIMQFSTEILMAYVDGELAADQARQIEAAMATDAELARQVERQRALRKELRAAFAGTLDEPIPARLLDAVDSSPAAAARPVIDIDAARAARAATPGRARWSWPEWTSVAASLLIGLLIGRTALQPPQSSLFDVSERGIAATGALVAALNEQPSGSAPADAAVGIGLSFRARNGDYCRTFITHAGTSTAGFACRDAQGWQIRTVSENPGVESGQQYRMAGSELPPAVLSAVQAEMAGEALDAAEEQAARAKGWRE